MAISVILPTYNRAFTLPRAIDSILAQTHTDFELIIVDDGSTDDSLELLSQYKLRDTRIKIICQENHGVSHARNRGIEMAKHDWIAFLDSDDEWLPEKLEMQMSFAHSSTDIKVIHGEEIWIRDGKFVNPKKKHKKSGGRIFSQCLPLCAMSPSTIMIHKEVFYKVGLFNEEFTVCEDYELWLRITSRYDVGFIETPIIKKYGGHDDQLSRKFKAMDHWRILAIDHMLTHLRDLLTEEEIRLATQTLLEKCRILILGYEKHGHVEKAKEIMEIRSKWLSRF